MTMPRLQFPTDRIVGTVEWDGSWSDERGPVLATGSVAVPDGVAVRLEIEPLLGCEPTGRGHWSMVRAREPLRLDFVRALPSAVIESVSIRSADEASFDALATSRRSSSALPRLDRLR